MIEIPPMVPDHPSDLAGAFADAGDVLPVEAMRRALGDWPAAAPPLLALLNSYAEGRDRSDRTAGAVFFVLHLAGQARETRAFAPLCRIARKPMALEAALGDGIDTSLTPILIGTWDGDLEGLKSLIEDREADGAARSSGLETLCWLAASGAVPREEAAAYLRGLHARMRPQSTSFAWFGWQEAIAWLGLTELEPLVEDAFRRDLIDPTIMDFADFREDLRTAAAREDRVALLAEQRIAPFADVIATLSGWNGFTEEGRREAARQRAAGPAPLAWDGPEPATNPFRDIGRNDPCPCGSGKKFKKCCLA